MIALTYIIAIFAIALIVIAVAQYNQISDLERENRELIDLTTNKRRTENAVTLINDERRRQQLELGWTAEHDDKAHADDDGLISAAMFRLQRDSGSVDGLVKVGALVAAEIDRRIRHNRRVSEFRAARVTRFEKPLQVGPGLPEKITLGIDEAMKDGDMTAATIAMHENGNVHYLDHVQVSAGQSIPPIVGEGKDARFDRGKDTERRSPHGGRFDRRTDLLPDKPQC